MREVTATHLRVEADDEVAVREGALEEVVPTHARVYARTREDRGASEVTHAGMHAHHEIAKQRACMHAS